MVRKILQLFERLAKKTPLCVGVLIKKHPFVICIAVILVIAISSVMASINIANQGVVLPNVRAWGTDLGGLTKDELDSKLKRIAEEYLARSLVLTTDSQSISTTIESLGLSLDASVLAERVYAVGRGANWLDNQITLLSSNWKRHSIREGAEVDKDVLAEAISGNFDNVYSAYDARIELQSGGKFLVIPGKDGLLPDINNLADQLIDSAHNGVIDSLVLKAEIVSPEIGTGLAEQALDLIEHLQSEPVMLRYDNKAWKLSFKEHADWIQVAKEYNRWQEPYLAVSLSDEKVKRYLKEEILARVEVKARDVALKKDANGNLVIEGFGINGVSVDIVDALQKLYREVPQGRREISLLAQKVPARVIADGIDDDLGIKQLIAEGESDFRKSPPNRIHNIKTGMAKFNNVLIAPGELFSFGKQLGPVDDETGYKKELVIKEGGKNTIPEFGGGICQVSTTAYRAALNAGLPITQRKSHSYAVVYYNPPGLDATVYPPSTDLKFINDTPGYILLQTVVDEKHHMAYFNFYGTSDGRRVELITAGKYDIVSIGNPVYEATDELPSGVTKLKPHGEAKVGYKVRWDRKVFFVDGTVKEDSFLSSYRAFPAYYWIGKSNEEPAEQVNA